MLTWRLPRFNSVILYVLWLSFVPVTLALAKKDLVNYSAKQLVCDKLNGKPCIQLKGEVVFKFPSSGVVLHADEAYYYNDSALIEAYGNIKILNKQGDIVQADKLFYDQKKKLATLENHVVCKTGDSTLYTSKLFYDFLKKQGKFVNQGKVVHKETVVTSCSGIYDEAAQTFEFLQDVVIADPEFKVYSDQVCYNFKKEDIFFKNHTKIHAGQNILTTEKWGKYCMPKKRFLFQEGTLVNQDIKLYADILEIIDDQDYKAKNHVELTVLSHDMVLLGDEVAYSRKTQRAEMRGRPLLTKVLNNDVVYIRADKFVMVTQMQKEVLTVKEFQALHDVQCFYENFQSSAERVVYNLTNNVMRLENNPIIWCSGYQVTGHSIDFFIGKEQHKMTINRDVFIVSDAKGGYYNQIKGKQLTAEFKGSVLEKMRIEGNSESIFFIFTDKKELIGMNNMKCDNMEIIMKDNTLSQVRFMPQPSGIFYPCDKIDREKGKLDGFHWYKEKWPTKERLLGALT